MVRLLATLGLILLTGCKTPSSNEPSSTIPVSSTAAPGSDVAPNQHPTADSAQGFQAKPGAPPTKEMTESVKFYTEHLAELKSKLSKLAPHELDKVVCPPQSFMADGRRAELGKVLSQGPSSSVFVLKGGQRIIKVAEPQLAVMSLGEQAALRTIARSAVAHIAPKVATSTSLSRACEVRSVVMDLVQGQPLDALRMPPMKEIAQMGLEVLRLLEQLHSIGLVHGDVHAGNIVMDYTTGSLTLVGFDQAVPYVDVTGTHVPMIPHSWTGRKLRVLFASIGDLKSLPRSRADDLFRLAEGLVGVIDGWDMLFDTQPDGRTVLPSHAVLLDRKLTREFSANVPAGLVSFYRATAAMGFSEDPDYSKLASFLNSVN